MAAGERDQRRKKTDVGVGDVCVPPRESTKGEERPSYGEPHNVPVVGIRADVTLTGEDGGGW